MRFTIAQPILKGMNSILSSIVTEAKVTCDGEGLKMLCVDPAHVAMVGFTIPGSVLEDYEYGEGGEFVLDLEKLASVLKLTSADEKVSVSVGDKMVFKFGNITRSMSIISNTDVASPKIPPIETPCWVRLSANTLQNALKGVQDIRDSVHFKISGGTFSMTSEDDTNSSEYAVRNGDEAVEMSEGMAISEFPQDYVVKAVKSMPSSYTIKLGLGDDYPMKMEFTDGTVSGFYMIAPRIEQGD